MLNAVVKPSPGRLLTKFLKGHTGSLLLVPFPLLSHALCFSLLKASAHIVELNNMFGQIQSPGYPDAYPSDSEVTWNITVPEGFRIKLYFMHFNLESSYLCEYDYVKVRS